MRKSTSDSCDLCPALQSSKIGAEEQHYCQFFESPVDPATDGCKHQFINTTEYRVKLTEIKSTGTR